MPLGDGAGYRLTDHLSFGAGADWNVLTDEDDVHGWRIITDVLVDF